MQLTRLEWEQPAERLPHAVHDLIGTPSLLTRFALDIFYFFCLFDNNQLIYIKMIETGLVVIGKASLSVRGQVCSFVMFRADSWLAS